MELSFGRFLVFAIIGLSMTLQMQSGTAISCEPGETAVTGFGYEDGKKCREELQTKCRMEGREVSHLEHNSWDTTYINGDTKVCEGCCKVPPPCPVKPVEDWNKCPATDINKTFKIENYTGRDCHRCQDGCKANCDAIGARVGDEICGYLFADNEKTIFNGLWCICCCRENVPCAPPQPPTPSLPPPSPSPPPPIPENICKSEDIYVAFRLSNPSSCDSCSSDCKAKCSTLGSSMTTQECISESSSSLCRCCCETPPPSPSPPPPSCSSCGNCCQVDTDIQISVKQGSGGQPCRATL